jgi:flagellum-specific ATP synthase
VLSRDLAGRNHYPAIDILASISRTMPDVTDVQHRRRAADVREWLATLRDTEDLVSVGAYVKGTTPRIDRALERRDPIAAFLCQPSDTLIDFADAVAGLGAL